MSPSKGIKHHLPIFITFLAFALRLYRLNYQPIWWDEGRNIAASLLPLPAITSAPGMDIHPPLYFYTLHFWLGATGQSEFAARFLSTIFSLLTVALMFCLGRQLFNDKVGLLAGLVTALSPLFIHEAQEARMYTMALFLSTLSMLLLWRAWRERKWLLWLGYILAATASIYTHYAAFFILVVQNIVALVFTLASRPRPKALLTWIVSQGGIGFLYLPQLPSAVSQAASYRNPNLVPPTFGQFVRETWQAFNTDLNVDASLVAPFLVGIGLVLAMGILVGLLTKGKVDLPSILVALLWFCLPLATYYLLLQSRSMFHPRYAMLVTPAYFLLLAYAIVVLWQRLKVLGLLSAGVVISAFLLGVNSYYFDPDYFRDDTRGLAEFVVERATEKDVIVLDFPYPFQYYYHGPAPAHYLFADSKTSAESLTTLAQGKEIAYLAQWYKSDSDPRGLIPFLLKKYGCLLGEAQFRGYRLSWYGLPSSPSFSLAGQTESTELNFGEVLALTRYAFGGQGQGETSSEAEVNRSLVPAGKFAWVVLNFRLLSHTDEDYKASLYLEDKAGHLVGQDDRLIISDLHLRTSNWSLGDEALNVYPVPIAPGTPPGEYQLELAVYRAATLERLGVSAGDGVFGSSFDLGSIEVVRPISPPPASALAIQNPYPLEFQEISLLGYDSPNTSAQQGGRLTLALYWRAREKVERDYLVHLSLRDEQGTLWGEIKTRPALGGYSTSQWEKGEIVKDWHDVHLPKEAPLGQLKLMLGLIDSATGEETREVQLASITVRGRERVFAAPPIEHPLEFYLDHKVKLLGYNLQTESLGPGGSLRLVLFWQAMGEMATSYTVFTHLLDEDNHIRGQKDNVPGGGAIPTTEWLEGEIIADEYEIPLDPRAPEGDYILEIGMYDAQTGMRLSVLDAAGEETGDEITLTTIRVEAQ